MARKRMAMGTIPGALEEDERLVELKVDSLKKDSRNTLGGYNPWGVRCERTRPLERLELISWYQGIWREMCVDIVLGMVLSSQGRKLKLK